MKIHFLLPHLAIVAFVVPIPATSYGPNVARADQIAMPRNQTEFDRFAARLDASNSAEREAQLSRAGHAFDNGEARLFWFTDLEAARAQAERENKPILSLRLLGDLSDEMSCANSRLFRVLLYANAQINRRLHDDFVLHWSRERPVPVATIDMGDGRVFKRTLTGNSAHYLLSADGQPLDVLPGLYAPAEFAAWLRRGADFARDWRAMKVDLRPKMLRDWHRGRLIDGVKTRGNRSDAIGGANQIIAANLLASGRPAPKSVPARSISGLAMPKALGERPILNAFEAPQRVVMMSGGGPPRAVQFVKNADGSTQLVPLLEDIPLVSGLFRSETANAPAIFDAAIFDAAIFDAATFDAAMFDAATRARIAAMQPGDNAHMLIQTLEENVARDTRSNRDNFEPAIDAYFVNVARPDFDKLNRAIYDKLFQTPASDPWLGLAPADAFVALRNGGVQSASSPR